MADDQHIPERTYPNGPVVNYGALADYEPRIADPTGRGSHEAWGRGVPRYLVIYAGALFVPLLVISYLGPLQVVFDLFGSLMHLVAVALIATVLGGWAWAMPPGGVRAHHAIPSIARGLRMPRVMLGWRPVAQAPAGWAPVEVLIEPDFAGPWPRTLIAGPARVIRSQAAAREIHPGARPGEIGLVLIEGTGPRVGGPVMFEVPDGHLVELRPAAGTRTLEEA